MMMKNNVFWTLKSCNCILVEPKNKIKNVKKPHCWNKLELRACLHLQYLEKHTWIICIWTKRKATTSCVDQKREMSIASHHSNQFVLYNSIGHMIARHCDIWGIRQSKATAEQTEQRGFLLYYNTLLCVRCQQTYPSKHCHSFTIQIVRFNPQGIISWWIYFVPKKYSGTQMSTFTI